VVVILKKNTMAFKLPKKTSKGLGDSIEKFTEVTGIKKIVDKVSKGKDCGCNKRKKALNKMFPYKNE
jgi:hypothetical protein